MQDAFRYRGRRGAWRMRGNPGKTKRWERGACLEMMWGHRAEKRGGGEGRREWEQERDTRRERRGAACCVRRLRRAIRAGHVGRQSLVPMRGGDAECYRWPRQHRAATDAESPSEQQQWQQQPLPSDHRRTPSAVARYTMQQPPKDPPQAQQRGCSGRPQEQAPAAAAAQRVQPGATCC